MKRSTHVAAPLLAAAALALNTGCRKPEMQRCVDEHNVVVDDSHCANLPADQQGDQQVQRQPDGHGGFIPLFFPYHYYYGGLGGYALGSIASGGSFTPTEGLRYANSSGRITRGGFGSSFSEGGSHGSSSGESTGS
jgi:hypothetical protein